MKAISTAPITSAKAKKPAQKASLYRSLDDALLALAMYVEARAFPLDEIERRVLTRLLYEIDQAETEEGRTFDLRWLSIAQVAVGGGMPRYKIKSSNVREWILAYPKMLAELETMHAAIRSKLSLLGYRTWGEMCRAEYGEDLPEAGQLDELEIAKAKCRDEREPLPLDKPPVRRARKKKKPRVKKNPSPASCSC